MFVLNDSVQITSGKIKKKKKNVMILFKTANQDL